MLVRASSGSGGGGGINPDIQYESSGNGDSAQTKTFSVTSGKTYMFNCGVRGTSNDKDNLQLISGGTVLEHTQVWTAYRQDGYWDYSNVLIFTATSSSVTIGCTKSANPTMTGMALIQLD